MGGDRILLPSIIMLMLLVLFALVAVLREKQQLTPLAYRFLLGALILGALVAYAVPPFGRVAPRTGAPHIHYYDVYHYYVGAKYFRELGYEGIYEATVVADFEDEREQFRPGVRVRDLRDGTSMRTRGQIVNQSRIAQRFTPKRWAAFKRDVALFRAPNPQAWHASVIQRDHGYNGTPLTTLLLGTLSGLASGETSTFLLGVVWVDLVLVVALAVVVGWMLGAESGLTLLFFWLVNPLGGYEYVGGSFLRYDYFVATALGLVFFLRGRPIASGVAFAFATLVRLFPALFLLALLAADLVSKDRRERLRSRLPLAAAFGATTLILLAITSAVPTPDGRNAWAAFAERIREHEQAHAPNSIGLAYLFMVSREHDARRVRESEGALDWVEETTRTFEERRAFYGLAVALVLAGCVVYARRTRPEDAPFLGLVGLFSLILATSYYWCVLALLPLLFANDRRVLLALAGTMIAILLTGWSLLEVEDLRFALYSLEIGLLLAGVAVWRARSRSIEATG